MARGRKAHTINGKFLGMWYETATGRKLYLAHRAAKDVRNNAWCFDLATLERCKAEGFNVVGVVRRQGKVRLVWLTHVDDFFTSPHSFATYGTARERALPLPQFRIDPSKETKFIEIALRLR